MRILSKIKGYLKAVVPLGAIATQAINYGLLPQKWHLTVTWIVTVCTFIGVYIIPNIPDTPATPVTPAA